MKLKYLTSLAIIFLCSGCSNLLVKSDFLLKEKTIQNSKSVDNYYYVDKNGKEIKYGPFVSRRTDKNGNFYFSEMSAYINGKQNGLRILRKQFITEIRFVENNKIMLVDRYNLKFEKISSLRFKNGQPYDGTLWQLFTGLNIKKCDIAVYQNGELINEIDCDLNGYEEVDKDDLIIKKNIFYKKNTEIPFTGVVYTYYDDYTVKTKQYIRDGIPFGDKITFPKTKWNKGVYHILEKPFLNNALNNH